MNLVVAYKVPKDQELFKKPLEKGFRLLTDLGSIEISCSMLIGYLIDLIEHPAKYRFSQIFISK